jgi:hypothetical protein
VAPLETDCRVAVAGMASPTVLARRPLAGRQHPRDKGLIGSARSAGTTTGRSARCATVAASRARQAEAAALVVVAADLEAAVEASQAGRTPFLSVAAVALQQEEQEAAAAAVASTSRHHSSSSSSSSSSSYRHHSYRHSSQRMSSRRDGSAQNALAAAVAAVVAAVVVRSVAIVVWGEGGGAREWILIAPCLAAVRPISSNLLVEYCSTQSCLCLAQGLTIRVHICVCVCCVYRAAYPTRSRRISWPSTAVKRRSRPRGCIRWW